MTDADAAEFCAAVRTRLVGALTLACGDRGIAEELPQETLARAWERWPQVGRMGSPEGWMFRTGFNLASSWRRRWAAGGRANRRSVGPSAVEEPVLVPKVEAVRRAVSQLPTRQRAVIEGMIPTEIWVAAPGGGVSVRFLTPRTITVGRDHQLLRSYVEDLSTVGSSLWTGHAFEGLPAVCPLGEHRRWEEVGPERTRTGHSELFPQLNLEPGESGGSANLRDVPGSCRGDFTLVLLATGDPVNGEVVERRVPFSIK